MTDAYYYGKRAKKAREAQELSGQTRTRTGKAPYRAPKRGADPGAAPLNGNRKPVQPDNAMKGRRLGGKARSGEWQYRKHKTTGQIQRRKRPLPPGVSVYTHGLTGEKSYAVERPWGGGNKVQGTGAAQGVLEDLQSGPDQSQVVSSGAMIRARQQAEQERALMDARQQLGVVPPPPGRRKKQKAATPEQQVEIFKTIGDRFSHAWKMDDIARAREHIEDWFGAGGTWDNMPASMEYLARQIAGAQGGQTAVEKGLAGKAAEAAETEQQSDATAARTATTFAQQQADRPGEIAQAAAAEGRTATRFEQQQADREAGRVAAAQTARGKVLTKMETTVGTTSGPALESYYNKVVDNTTPEERESMPAIQALASRIAAGEEVFAPGMSPKRAERYATLTQSLMEGGEYMETGKSTAGTDILVKRLTKQKAVPVLSMAEWPTDVKADKLAAIGKAADREKFMLEGNDKYLGLNGVHKRLLASMYRDAKARGLSNRQAKKFAEKHAQDVFLGYLAKNAELYNMFVTSKYATKKIDKKVAAQREHQLRVEALEYRKRDAEIEAERRAATRMSRPTSEVDDIVNRIGGMLE